MISTSWYIISCNFGGRIMNGFDRSYFIEGGSETPMARSREAKKKNKPVWVQTIKCNKI